MFVSLQAVLVCGHKFIDEGHSNSDEIKARCDQLQENWDELKNLAEQRCVHDVTEKLQVCLSCTVLSCPVRLKSFLVTHQRKASLLTRLLLHNSKHAHQVSKVILKPLIICEENRNEITTVKEAWIPGLNLQRFW